MARPKSPELTERELELMHVFWEAGPLTAVEARDQLARSGRDLAYTTVATLTKILVEKRFLKQTGRQRPFVYQPLKTFEDVSKRLVGDMVKRVFQGSREDLLLRLLEDRELTKKERDMLQKVLQEGKS